MTRPIVLLGETRSRTYLRAMAALGWGRMWTVGTPSTASIHEPWGFDNGAFVAWSHGEPFPRGIFESRLTRALTLPAPPLVAVTPDIVAGGERSLEFSLAWRPQLPDAWPWFLAVQDGMDPADVADALPAFAGLFLGGATAFKRTAGQWAAMAHAAGKRFHYGRASLPRRVDHAIRVGADSLDTSFPLWTSARFDAFVSHWQHGSPQLDLGVDLQHTVALAGPAGEWF
jgi:hypothetical protein